MKALLDTNIVIHREANRVLDRDIGNLFKWLDKTGYEKCVHPLTVAELRKNSNKQAADLFCVKLDSYVELTQVAPLHSDVVSVASRIDVTENDKVDTCLLNEVFCGRVDIIVTEDKKIHQKAALLHIEDKAFTIDSFLEKVTSEHPEFIDYKVLSVVRRKFGQISLADPFFDTLKADYPGFEGWFNRKAEETAYVTFIKGRILSFLFLKVEDVSEPYSDITPCFMPKRRLKIGTFKVVANGIRLGERFLKIIFDNAVLQKVDEIYVTIFDHREEQIRLINLLELWGFVQHGIKQDANGQERVYVRDMKKRFLVDRPRESFPYISRTTRAFLLPIYPDYHTELLPDSILRTESPDNFIESNPHRNAISKVYICRSINREAKRGDIIIFYRTGGYYKAVVSTIGIVEDVITNIHDENDFIAKCRKRSVFPDAELKKFWNYNLSIRPFIINFLYAYSFKHRMNMAELIDTKVLFDVNSAPRGLMPISKEQFSTILKGTRADESFIVD